METEREGDPGHLDTIDGDESPETAGTNRGPLP